jgi:hypothetical protein
VEAWTRLQPVFRHHLGKATGQTLLGYLAFFTASDALVSLDAMGPSLGIDISEDGFNRLIRMLIADGLSPRISLMEENPRFRQLLGLPAWPRDSEAMLDRPPYTASGLAGLLGRLLLPGSAWAGSPTTPPPPLEAVSRWMADSSGYNAYVGRVRELLEEKTLTILDKQGFPGQYKDLFRLMVQATAWQESCMKHYLTSGGDTVSYVRSYNNTSVGLMQINEHVWKGLYSLDRLRWDIGYNAMAGCEILEVYFNRYAVKQMKSIKGSDSWKDTRLAGSVYAMYNGGPKDFQKFLTRDSGNRLQLSDRLFREKFQWVKENAWNNLDQCF